MKEGGLEAPTRHPINWQSPDYYDAEKLEAEMERVFDVCHGCRRCFNLCDSFPRLFDMIDESESGELDSVDPKDYQKVVDGCTLCDLCYMTKCPYVPPHELNIDFPHLMLQHRAVAFKESGGEFTKRQLTKTDRNGKIGTMLSPLANWATSTNNGFTRTLLEWVANVHRKAYLPEYTGKQLTSHTDKPPLNTEAPAYGQKVVLYATCYGNYNTPEIGLALRAVLAVNGVEAEILHPSCCGMPQLEQGDLQQVAQNAETVADAFLPWIEKGYEIIALVPSCALMLKSEWPLLLKDNAKIKTLAENTSDVSEYIVALSKKYGLAEGMKPLDGGVSVHVPCHARAQNIGNKAAEMLTLIPDTKIDLIERCSGHGGAWGVEKENFPVALKVGKYAFKAAAKNNNQHLVSECPLAGQHLIQGLENEGVKVNEAPHPIQLIAQSYGLVN